MPQRWEMENATGHVWNAEWQLEKKKKKQQSKFLMLGMFPILCL